MFQQTLDKAYAEYAVLEQRHQLPNCQVERLQFFPSACSSCNSSKNRYPNVLPPEKTRIVLEGEDDYINANLLQYQGTKFISCQAPVPSTFSDFWRMVWEKRSPLIIMLTNLVEKGVQKADSYWPAEDQAWFGDILVKLCDTQEVEGTTVRTIKLLKGSQSRQIFQLHFTAWPDFGVPQMASFLNLLSLTEDALAHSSKDLDGPPIVHCSAGVGRSGAFIASRIAVKELKKNRTPSVFDIVQTLREQRHGMVQTKDQYLFIYLVLNHHLVNMQNKSGEKTVSLNTFRTVNSRNNSPAAMRLSPNISSQRPKRKYSGCRREDSSPNKAISLSLSFSFPPDNINSFGKSPLTHSDGGIY